MLEGHIKVALNCFKVTKGIMKTVLSNIKVALKLFLRSQKVAKLFKGHKKVALKVLEGHIKSNIQTAWMPLSKYYQNCFKVTKK